MKFNVFLLYFIIIYVKYYTYCFRSRFQPSTGKFYNNKPKSDFKPFLKGKETYFEDVRGSQCYLPNDQRIQRWLQNKWDITSKKFGFQEYSMPVLVYSDLFSKSDEKLENTHNNELYTFTDKKGRRLSLRGDITPQFMNMLKTHIHDDSTHSSNIYKWYTISDCWRYEKPSFCRRRNHIQWSTDIVGIDGQEVELELISMLIHFFKSVGLYSKDVKISINHKNITPELLKTMGFVDYSSEWYYEFSKIIDKYKKNSRDKIDKMLMEIGFSENKCSELHRIFDNTKSLIDLERMIERGKLDELRKFIKGVEDRGYLDWIELDLTIVRGNDYYTGIVFECFDRENILNRSLAGGGRYDNYLKDCDPVLNYSAGFGMGNISITNLLKQKNLVPEFSGFVDVLVFTPNVEQENKRDLVQYEHPEVQEHQDNIFCSIDQKKCLYRLMDLLRDNEYNVYHYYKTSKMKKALRFADKCMAKFILMPFKHNKDQVIMLKNLDTKAQEYFDISNQDLGQLILHKINDR